MKHFKLRFSSCSAAMILGAALSSGVAYANDDVAPAAAAPVAAPPAAAPAPTKHRLMKECMRKEKAAISGRENYELSADCKDITKTEKQNADAEKTKADRTEADKKAANPATGE
jgi:hypothetical protein